MQKPGRNHEAHRIGERVGRRRHLHTVGMPVEDRERADDHRGDPDRRPRLERDDEPEHDRREGDAGFDGRKRNAKDAEPAADAITRGNTTGSSQIAGAPRNAPHRPTATMATTWSQPKIGCRKPLVKPPTAFTGMRERGRRRQHRADDQDKFASAHLRQPSHVIRPARRA